MRVFLLPIFTLVSACSTVDNTFVVMDEQKAVSGAKLVLCGSEVPLRQSGDRLSVSKAIDCEGSGYITLRYASGDEHVCVIGYVTPGAAQSFTFRATERGCA